MRRPWVNRLILPISVLLVYFVLPERETDAPIGVVLGALVTVCGLVAVAWVVIDEVRRSEKRLQLVHLLLALELVVVIFASAYYGLSVRQPGEFTRLATRLDALYFSLTTVATVGYGDISASGQFARLLVSVQLVFNLVFVAALVGLFQGQLHARAVRRDADGGGTEGTDL